ncbi:SH3 and multiple ankyrin repeat domains protein 2 isoform X1 [Pteropus vampyrus]|uniref:SH3 and multiple ankyrin repeat domains protein 2 isoform X1 n=1 Tax=Pteropus vampyrus TaxID=132908 RepID=A0A6P3RXC1_PTEVA|nr:SH3 and multiple ankyrin repeat domains protein 2 isoform X1 [Pteropus vampyrus]
MMMSVPGGAAAVMMTGHNNGRCPRNSLCSDCIIEEKTVVLQKNDHEGFGFVLRGAKADTPIEEFTPTPAFPALQYLESVDEGGVAWQAGLRTGDFLIEVNNENVVKVGHRQVVNMIRQGGNHLVLKVVTVTRNLDPDDTARKKAPPPPKRAPTTALTLRSKSMTSELEELVDKASVRKKKDKADEVVPAPKPSRAAENMAMESRVATIKPRPTSRCFPPVSDVNSVYERQGIAVMTPTVPGSPKGPCLGLPRGTMRRQKSIDSRIFLSGITEEERQFLAPPMLKFTRSLSMPDTSEDIPPPPQSVPPSPPPPSPTAYNCPKSPTPRVYGTIKPAFTQNSAKVSPAARSDTVVTMAREKGMYYRRELDRYSLDSDDLYSRATAAQANFRSKRGQMPENPYSEVGKIASKAVYVPAKPARRKGMLVKQSNVEDSPEKTCSIPIPTIIVKEPSTSSSGKSSQGSSMEIDPQASEQPGQLRPDDGLTVSSPFAAAIAGAVRDREKRLEARRNSPAFLSTDLGDEDVGLGLPAPRVRPSTFPEEGGFGEEDGADQLSPTTPGAAPREPESHFVGGGEAAAQGEAGRPANFMSKAKGPDSSPAVPPKSGSVAGPENYVHPLTGRLLDPSSPLALALSARDRAMKESQQGPKGEAPKADLNKPLYIDTKMRPSVEAGFPPVTRQNTRGLLRRQETENKYESDLGKDRKGDDKKNMLINIMDTSQQKSAGLLMVHTVDAAKPEDFLEEEDEKADMEMKLDNLPPEVPEGVPETEGALQISAGPAPTATTPGRTMVAAGSMEEAVILPFRIPPPPLASVDLDEDFVFTEPLPPPLEFANSFDIPDDRVASVPALTDLVKQKKNDTSPSPSLNSSQPANSADGKKPAGLSNCLPASFLPPPESFDTVTDSGIEEVDSRSGSDHHLETTSTISTVSSISTLSSEGGESMDTCTVHADGQAFVLDRPPVPPKPKMKPIIHKSNALYQDALMEEDADSFVMPPPAPLPPPGGAQPAPTKGIQPRTSKLWGDVSEVKSPILSGPKANVISELNSILQQMNREKSAKPGEGLDSPTGTKPAGLAPRSPEVVSTISGTRSTTVTFTVRPGTAQPITLQSRPPDYESRTSGPRRAPSPVVSPTEMSKEMLPPAPAAAPSPALSDVFGLPSQPPSGDLFGLSPAGRSRSPSPSILQQPGSTKPFTAKPVHLWTKPDVADWLESLNLGEHKETFMDNEIDGSHLPNLQKEDLIDLGVTRVGHRMNIERALKQLLDR